MDNIARQEPDPPQTLARAEAVAAAHYGQVARRADRLLSNVLGVQWLGAVLIALWLTPRTWWGGESAVHIHVWAAVFLGGVLTLGPVLLAHSLPGRSLTRHVIAVAQMGMGALLIHLTGGRIETHFHVFGSLAFLAFYRDWRVLVTASAVVS